MLLSVTKQHRSEQRHKWGERTDCWSGPRKLLRNVRLEMRLSDRIRHANNVDEKHRGHIFFFLFLKHGMCILLAILHALSSWHSPSTCKPACKIMTVIVHLGQSGSPSFHPLSRSRLLYVVNKDAFCWPAQAPTKFHISRKLAHLSATLTLPKILSPECLKYGWNLNKYLTRTWMSDWPLGDSRSIRNSGITKHLGFLQRDKVTELQTYWITETHC